MKKKAIKLLEDTLSSLENDQKTGFEEGIYDSETTTEIETLKDFIDRYKDHRPDIYIFVEGGLIQGASATESICVNIYDNDCAKDGDEEYLKENGTVEEWDKMIKKGHKSGELIVVH